MSKANPKPKQKNNSGLCVITKILNGINNSPEIYAVNKYPLGNQPSNARKTIQAWMFGSKMLLAALQQKNVCFNDDFRLNWECNGVHKGQFRQIGSNFDLVDAFLSQILTDNTATNTDNTVFEVTINMNGKNVSVIRTYIRSNALTSLQKMVSKNGEIKSNKAKQPVKLDIVAGSPVIRIDLGEKIEHKGEILMEISEDEKKEINKTVARQTKIKDSERELQFKRFAVCPGISKLKHDNDNIYPILTVLRDFITRTAFSIWISNNINLAADLNIVVSIERNNKEYHAKKILYNQTIHKTTGHFNNNNNNIPAFDQINTLSPLPSLPTLPPLRFENNSTFTYNLSVPFPFSNFDDDNSSLNVNNTFDGLTNGDISATLPASKKQKTIK